MVDDNKMKRRISISSGISSFTVLGSGAMSSADVGSSNISGSL